MMQATDPDAIPKEVSLEERVRLLEMQNKILRFHLSAQLERGQQSSPEDVVKILDRFGLMQNGIQNRSGEFMLSCIFAAMQGQLDKTLLEWNVSKKAKVAVSSKVQFLLDRIRDVLKTGYKPIGPEHENAEVESSASSEHKLELFFDEEFLEI